MSKPTTYVAIILDRSGSMSSIRTQAVNNYNEQIQQMKENAKDQNIFATLVTFNGSVWDHHWHTKAEDLEEADESSFIPNGATALRDAIGHTITKMQETTQCEENAAYLLVIISDGEENSSMKYSQQAIKEMIESAQATGKWTFSFMGCSEEYVKEVAEKTSIPLGNCAVWSNADAEISAKTLSIGTEKRNSYYKSRNFGLTSSDCLYSSNSCSIANFTKESSGTVNQTSIDNLINQIDAVNSPTKSIMNVNTPKVKGYRNDIIESHKRYTFDSCQKVDL